ncbi:MAG: ATP-binding protein [Candidatus Aminicenantes bacterium]|nr:ATP-binding protein [Candidatus Aminicenantes bacterium]
MEAIKVESDLSEINKIRAYLKRNLNTLSITEKDYYSIELSLLEICINIIRYAYPNEKGEIRVRTWNEPGKIILEVSDDGIPFDPRKTDDPDLEEMISGGKKGGMGIFLARKLMDGFDYRRKNGKNVVTLVKRI